MNPQRDLWRHFTFMWMTAGSLRIQTTTTPRCVGTWAISLNGAASLWSGTIADCDGKFLQSTSRQSCSLLETRNGKKSRTDGEGCGKRNAILCYTILRQLF